MLCADKSSTCSIWLSSFTVSWGTCSITVWLGQLLVLPLNHTSLIFSLISFCDYFLLLCALVLIIQKKVFPLSVKVWPNAGLVFFIVWGFFCNSDFILLLFCKIIGQDMQWPRLIPIYFSRSVPTNWMWVFTYCISFWLFFPHAHPSILSISHISNHFWFDFSVLWPLLV